MNRTQGEPNYTLVKPWMQLPSNCIVPTHVAEDWANLNSGLAGYWGMCGGLKGQVNAFQPAQVPDSQFGGAQYDPLNYPEINGGAGIRADLAGNEQIGKAPVGTQDTKALHECRISIEKKKETKKT